MAIRVTVWNEYLHEVQFPEVAEVYPKGIHGCIADFLKDAGMEVRTATLKEPEHGLTQEVLDNTDVLIWWGHMAHHEVADEIVDRVYKRVLEGMGLIVLHSGHASKIFQKLCGTDTWKLKWREDGEKEILWVVDPSHPIADGLDEKIIIPHEEMYGEHFNIPQPDELVFIRLGDVEVLAVHLLVGNDNLLVQAVRDGMAGVHHPQDLLFTVFPPLQHAGIGAADLLEDLASVPGVEHNQAHALLDALVHPVHDLVRHLMMGHVPPPDQHIGVV